MAAAHSRTKDASDLEYRGSFGFAALLRWPPKMPSQPGNAALSNALADLRRDLATAYRLVANEGILDAFGHISVRNPNNPNRYFLSHSRAPALVQPDDIFEYDLDSNPIVSPITRPYSERVIHGEIFKARPDVNAVCHHHAPSIMPFAISGVPLQPVFHLGAAMGQRAPFWDSRDEFGDTNLLVVKPEEGASLARALGSHAIVVMRRHGATVVGGELRELVFRTIYSAKNAEHQLAAHALGHVSPLTDGEAEMAAGLNLAPGPLARAYEYWVTRLAKSEGRSASDPSVKAASAAARGSVPGGASAAKSSAKPAAKTAKKVAKAKTKGSSKGRNKR
jgi:ribulose-5-phosphate 4-epimerase/fuculose-1-phosphate aldolase